MDNVKILEPLGNSDHNQIHCDIRIRNQKVKIRKRTRETSTKITTKIIMRKYLAKLDWNNMLMNKTAIEC